MTELSDGPTTIEQHFFDKLTGQKYLCLATTERDEIKYYRVKSEKTGDTILLSEFGFKLRFHKTPDIAATNLKSLFRRAANQLKRVL